MLYLTKLPIDASTAYREELKDDYALHRLIYSLFPLEKKVENPRILYADRGVERGVRQILVQSQIPPEGPKELKMSTLVIPDHFYSGGRYRFEAILNPVRKEAVTGKLAPVTGQLNVLEWFLGHMEKWGFSVNRNTLEAFVRSSRSFEKGGNACRFNRVLFRGTLAVTDREKFLKSSRDGIGRGKAFGFGLLQLRPVRAAE